MGIRGSGKTILEIDWEKDNVKVKIPVKAVMSNNIDGKFTGDQIMKFRAVYKEAGIDVEDTDINKIRDKVIGALDAWHSIEWTLYFMVRVDGGRYGSAGEKRFKIGYEIEYFVVGKDFRGTDKYMRVPRPDDISKFDKTHFTRWASTEPIDGVLETGEQLQRERWSRDCTTRSLVLATPESVAAAEGFILAMENLLQKMHHHFAPSRIEKLLQNPALLLPAPKKADGDR